MDVRRWIWGLLWFSACTAGAQNPLLQESLIQTDGQTPVVVVAALLTSSDVSSCVRDAPNGQLVTQIQERVTLPDSWSKPARSGRCQYTWDMDFEQAPSEAWALYIPRIGNRFVIEVNGKPVGHAGDFGDVFTNAVQRPFLFPLPRGTLTAGSNHFVVDIEGERNRYAGLSKVQVGPERDLRPKFAMRSAAQLGGSFAVVVMCGVFGVLALLLYIRLRQPSDAFFAAACLLCALRTSYFVFETVPFPYRLWAWVADLSYGGLVACIVAFCVRALAMKSARWDPFGIAFVVVSVGLVTWNYFVESHRIRQVWLQLMLAYVLVMSVVFVWQWWRQRTVVSTLLGSAALGGALIGAYDHWLVYYSAQGYGGFALARFALVLFILAMGWIIVERLVNRMKEERAMRDSISKELDEKRRELAQEFEARAVRDFERAQGVEREKLIQDLHDGMGLQLNSLLGLVEKGEADPGEVQTEVRNSIEQLRTIVDGSEAFDGSLPELLGHIRYRIETRLKRQGIQLVWAGNLGERIQRVRPAAAISLQRLIFELCTNVIKHARAQNVYFKASLVEMPNMGMVLQIVFQDDGNSATQTSTPTGVGQRSVTRRVAELGGTHEMHAVAQEGWAHHLSIPVIALDL
jgi:signal transduction histidine kinase